jgi:tetratricopeptide (TPR) repeat protein
MQVRVIEKTIPEIESKINSISTDLSKISYMESALKANLTFDIKRFLYDKLSELYLRKKMFDKAAISISKKIAITTTLKEKVQACIQSGELFIKALKLFDADYMFNKAILESPTSEKEQIKIKQKNAILEEAEKIEMSGKKASCIQLYEYLLKITPNNLEREQIKQKIIPIYKSLGKFSEAKALEE